MLILAHLWGPDAEDLLLRIAKDKQKALDARVNAFALRFLNFDDLLYKDITQLFHDHEKELRKLGFGDLIDNMLIEWRTQQKIKGIDEFFG